VNSASPRSLQALYEQHFDLVWACLASHGVRAEDREDLVQEVWLLAHRRLSRLRDDASARAWLWSIAANVVRLHRRTKQRRDRKLRAAAVAREAVPPATFDHGDRMSVEQALQSLPEAQREVLMLTHHAGYSGPEIADLLGVSLNTVHSRLRLAKARMRDGTAAEDTREQRRRCWALIAAAPGLRSGMLAGWSRVAAWVGLGLLTTAWTFETPAATVDEAVRVRPQPVVVAPEPEPANPSLAVAMQPAPDVAPPPVPMPETSVAPPEPVRRKRRRRKAAPQTEPTDAPERSSAGPDVALLQRGLELNRAGRHRAALQVFERHARTFPRSPLWDARESAWVRALCRLGRTDQARTRAERALARGGSSIALHNSLGVCSS